MNPIRFARGFSWEWNSANPILNEAEPGYERDTKKLKIGDGVTPWNDLDYFAAGTEVSGGGVPTDEQLLAHINSQTPHPAYDDGPSLLLLYTNAKV